MDPRANPSVADCLQQAHRQGLTRVDAQMLLLHALARPVHERAWLLAHDTDLLTEAQQHNWGQALQRKAGFVQVQSRRDLGGIERCTGAVMPD